jgi:hypothetical protein
LRAPASLSPAVVTLTHAAMTEADRNDDDDPSFASGDPCGPIPHGVLSLHDGCLVFAMITVLIVCVVMPLVVSALILIRKNWWG